MAKKVVKLPGVKPKAKAGAKPKTRAKPKAKLTAKTETVVPLSRLSAVAMPPPFDAPDARVLDRLWATVLSRKDADPELSHSARLLARGTAKIAQKFGEEAVECLIEAVGGHRAALVAESADVLYHLLVMWVDAGVRPEQIWAELARREAFSGVTEKAARKPALLGFPTRKIP
jgi:phosphoribosyl-ATP pyrophosphohydrolase